MTKPKIIQQGAEAIIYLDKNKILKKRVKKSYRIPILDEKIRKLRTRNEAKLLKQAAETISIPDSIKENEKTKEIFMDYVEGKKLSEHLDSFPLKEQKEICEKIGNSVANIHDNNIIHGDLTTSNMILKDNEVYFIDFGLGFKNGRIEDKAVDLHVLKQALEARHFEHWQSLFNSVVKGYKKLSDSKKVLDQLEKVEKRGRYKH